MKQTIIKTNSQITKIKPSDLEKLPKRDKFDSTVDERDKAYQTSKADPRLREYR